MDVTDTTATVSDVASGKVFTQVDGTTGTGTASGGYSINDFIERSNVSGDVVYNGAITKLPIAAFAETQITSFSSDVITTAGFGYQFFNCTQLKTVSLPNFAPFATNTAVEMFRHCSSLETIYIPKFKRSGNYPFQGCSKLTMLVLPSIDYRLGIYACNECTLLNTVDIGENIGNTLCDGNAFTRTSLSTLILRRTAGVIGTAANNFTSGASFTCYVPSALISAYQTATNWSAMNITWKAIEGSYYETHYADGTPVT